MPYVITQSCCSDGSCVYSCPVNCIHPSPDEPASLPRNAVTSILPPAWTGGLRVTAPPGRRDRADTRLTDDQLPFIAVNADH